jgi:hypothetical protein
VPSMDSTRTVPVTKVQTSSNNPAGASNTGTRDSAESGAMRGTN